MQNIYAVIVTYNRLALLKECVEAVSRQSCGLRSIVIVDNCSTDGTKEYLDGIASEKIKVVHLPENIGGAGGFSRGIKEAVTDGADAVWVMDDDTIPNPDSLQKLAEVATGNPKAGFVGSRVVWTDGTEHNMNRPVFLSSDDEAQQVRQVKQSSFVSMLIMSEAIRAVGLPYKEFFIWKDDIEYARRIVNAGYEGLYALDSVVLHKTPTNYSADLSNAPVSAAWKFYYGQRNTVFMDRQKHGKTLTFFFKELNHLRLALRKLRRRPKEERAVFKEKLMQGFCDGLKFSPQIEYIC